MKKSLFIKVTSKSFRQAQNILVSYLTSNLDNINYCIDDGDEDTLSLTLDICKVKKPKSLKNIKLSKDERIFKIDDTLGIGSQISKLLSNKELKQAGLTYFESTMADYEVLETVFLSNNTEDEEDIEDTWYSDEDDEYEDDTSFVDEEDDGYEDDV